jgi:3-mercaptopyruvate sulfurtransferase SseA
MKNLHYLQGGFDAWRDAGYPLEPKAKTYAGTRVSGK